MCLVTRLCLPPVTAIDRRLGKKEAQILLQGGLIGLGQQHIIAPAAVDVCTTASLGVQGISSHDPPLHLGRREQGRFQRDLIALVGDRLLG